LFTLHGKHYYLWKVSTGTQMPEPIDRAGCLPKAVAIDMDEPAAIGRFEKQPTNPRRRTQFLPQEPTVETERQAAS
jgi:hypothetical protein